MPPPSGKERKGRVVVIDTDMNLRPWGIAVSLGLDRPFAWSESGDPVQRRLGRRPTSGGTIVVEPRRGVYRDRHRVPPQLLMVATTRFKLDDSEEILLLALSRSGEHPWSLRMAQLSRWGSLPTSDLEPFRNAGSTAASVGP